MTCDEVVWLVLKLSNLLRDNSVDHNLPCRGTSKTSWWQLSKFWQWHVTLGEGVNSDSYSDMMTRSQLAYVTGSNQLNNQLTTTNSCVLPTHAGVCVHPLVHRQLMATL